MSVKLYSTAQGVISSVKGNAAGTSRECENPLKWLRIQGLANLIEFFQMNSLWVKVLLFGLVAYGVYTLFFDGTMRGWTLMVCEYAHSSGGCGETSYILKGYPSERACVEKGIALKNRSGFECGKDCKMSDYGLYVCQEICNERGCS